MAFYNTRSASQVPTTMDYYGSMTTTAAQPMSMSTSMPGGAYDPYAVAPLTMQPPAHAGHHHSHSTASYLSTDPHHRVPTSSLPTQHRASSGAWNAGDDQTLLGARASGQNWAQIQQNYFPSKTPNACRKRHERLMERKGADDWDTRKLEKMAKEYMALRKEIWAPLALKTGEKWNVVEQKCMSNGLKNLQGAARAAARRERLEAGLPPTDPYNDDSGISGIDLTEVDDLDGDGGYGGVPSPDRSTTSSGGAGGSSTASQSYSTAPSTYGHPQAYPGYPTMGGHGYANSVSSSSGTAYGHHNGAQGHHSQSASPYMEAMHRMPSVDMGIDSIINRPGGQ
ncbi:hypothetical protein INS49_002024 [Diaporthe citri]|uniref:uncharacterized protein n=1 Tax=Diaporthe citri TaxID=83186 RepID=UPI001C812591|nr:uncharacterized protein INS49_002024 [Diaporthe citri]KAG6367829.1 hypothetical protein INS49_002024 [Diaporthe citri]